MDAEAIALIAIGLSVGAVFLAGSWLFERLNFTAPPNWFLAFLAVGLGFWGLLLIQFFVPRSPQVGVTPIDETSDVEDLLVDREAIPETYTGELADVDGDGTPDVALFGDPAAPVIRPLVSENPGRDWGPWAAGTALVMAAILGPATTQWARRRWPSPAAADDKT